MAKDKKEPQHHPFGIPDLLFLFAGGLLLLLLVVGALLPHVLGFTGYAVSSVSMEPALRRGDLLFVAPVTLAALEPGNLLTYQVNGAVLTHRVYALDEATGVVRTKADAQDHLDPLPVTEDQFIGRPVYKLPQLGDLSLPRGEKAVEP
ncbi:MAG: signal peptidase I [Pseudoflavonifractor sp.]